MWLLHYKADQIFGSASMKNAIYIYICHWRCQTIRGKANKVMEIAGFDRNYQEKHAHLSERCESLIDIKNIIRHSWIRRDEIVALKCPNSMTRFSSRQLALIQLMSLSNEVEFGAYLMTAVITIGSWHHLTWVVEFLTMKIDGDWQFMVGDLWWSYEDDSYAR